MSYSISTLLTRNLHDVFGENDPGAEEPPSTKVSPKTACSASLTASTTAKRKLIALVGKIKVTHPDFRYQAIAEPEELGNGGRVGWVSGRPREAPAYAGTDFIIARDGWIAPFISFSTSYHKHSNAWKDIAEKLPAVPGMSPSRQGAARRKSHGKIVLRVA